MRKLRVVRTLLALCAVAAAFVAVGFLILSRPFAPAPWEEAPRNSTSIYEAPAGSRENPSRTPVLSPFHLEYDPMAGLLLVNFEQDADRIYVGLEPQAFDDEIHGKGMLVIGWRVDGRVDVYHDPAIRLDPETYGIAGNGLHMMAERSFDPGHFELGPAGAQVDIAFKDLEGREIRLLIRETDPRPRSPFAFLAPMGSAASEPPALPLVYVHDFYFVRRAGTEIRIEIDGRAHRSDPIPLMLDGALVHFLRYSANPFIVTWNPTRHGSADVLAVTSEGLESGLRAESRGVQYELETNGDYYEIRRMARREGKHEVVVEFTPALPQLLALRDEAEVSGAFRISTHPDAGTVIGTYRVARHGRALRLEVMPSGGWTPAEAPRMARMLFRLVSTFRAWPTTYVWRGTLSLPTVDERVEGALPLQSAWERIQN